MNSVRIAVLAGTSWTIMRNGWGSERSKLQTFSPSVQNRETTEDYGSQSLFRNRNTSILVPFQQSGRSRKNSCAIPCAGFTTQFLETLKGLTETYGFRASLT